MRAHTIFAGSLLGLCLIVAAARATNSTTSSSTPPSLSCDACKIALVHLDGEAKIDQDISATQEKIKTAANPTSLIERLGWLFVTKARVSSDPGYYKLAEQCASCLQSGDAKSPAALLLQGHVLHSLHRFKEAEPIALNLVKTRGAPFDYGLLGDVEFDRGNIPAAVDAYQNMIRLKPELQSYGRVAQVRWITGDLEGAIEAMTMSAEAGSILNPEPTAWSFSRLALYQLQAGKIDDASLAARTALKMQPDYPPALYVWARVQLAQTNVAPALESIQKAASATQLPDQQWLLADTLRLLGREQEAAAVETEMDKHGAAADPRNFSLYLATRGQKSLTALKLAQREMESRADVFTHDALAWALRENGQLKDADIEMDKALAENTQDARLFFHKAVIAAALGQDEAAFLFAKKASAIKQMLFPSEQEQLSRFSHRTQLSQKSN